LLVSFKHLKKSISCVRIFLYFKNLSIFLSKLDFIGQTADEAIVKAPD